MKIIQSVLKLPHFRKCCRNAIISRSYAEGPPISLARKEGWESAIGLEVHAQVASQTKIFSSAQTNYGAPVNTQVALFDCAIPGTLPVLNKRVVEAGVLTALALSCQINTVSTFDRKHYFYADLPAGYQITQQRNPLASKGRIDFVVYNSSCHKNAYNHHCKIIQLQLEQDSGKSLHDNDLQRSLIDLNRAGVALMEIVFEPNLKDGEEAAALIKELVLILQKLETCDCKLEEGSFRVDANISVNRVGNPLGIRTEVKNLSSIRSIANAIEYEVKRQIEVLEGGGEVVNETRSFDVITKQTVPMRDKEVKQDYRFMPEPNLPPLRLSYDPHNTQNTSFFNVATIQKRMKELPENQRRKLNKKYGLSLETALVVISIDGLYDYFINVMRSKADASGARVAKYLQGAVLELLYVKKIDFIECKVNPKEIADLVTLLEEERITHAKASDVLKLLILEDDPRTTQQIFKDEGLEQINDEETIKKLCFGVIENNEKLVGQCLKNSKKYFPKLTTAFFNATEGKVNMKKANTIMKALIEKKD